MTAGVVLAVGGSCQEILNNLTFTQLLLFKDIGYVHADIWIGGEKKVRRAGSG